MKTDDNELKATRALVIQHEQANTDLLAQLERSVKLCESAREKERASVVRYLRKQRDDYKSKGGYDNCYVAEGFSIVASLIEAGNHVRDELGGDDDRG